MQLITREEAKGAVERCAFTIPEGLDGAGRVIVHCQLGTLGADWDVDAVLDLIATCTEAEGVPQVAWGDHVFWGRCLGVLNGGTIYWFDNVTPEAVS